MSVLLQDFVDMVDTKQLAMVRRDNLLVFWLRLTVLSECCIPKLIGTRHIEQLARILLHIGDNGISQLLSEFIRALPVNDAQVLVNVTTLLHPAQYILCVSLSSLILLGGLPGAHVERCEFKNARTLTFETAFHLANIGFQETNAFRSVLLEPIDQVSKNTTASNRRKLIGVPNKDQALYRRPVDGPEESSNEF